MVNPMGEAKRGPLRVGFDRRPDFVSIHLKLEFHGSHGIEDAQPHAPAVQPLYPSQRTSGALGSNRRS